MPRKTRDRKFLRQGTPFCTVGWERTKDVSACQPSPSCLGKRETISATESSTYWKKGCVLAQDTKHFLFINPCSWYRQKKTHTQ